MGYDGRFSRRPTIFYGSSGCTYCYDPPCGEHHGAVSLKRCALTVSIHKKKALPPLTGDTGRNCGRILAQNFCPYFLGRNFCCRLPAVGAIKFINFRMGRVASGALALILALQCTYASLHTLGGDNTGIMIEGFILTCFSLTTSLIFRGPGAERQSSRCMEKTDRCTYRQWSHELNNVGHA